MKRVRLCSNTAQKDCERHTKTLESEFHWLVWSSSTTRLFREAKLIVGAEYGMQDRNASARQAHSFSRLERATDRSAFSFSSWWLSHGGGSCGEK